MIQVEQHGPVTAIRMARSVLGRPIYWTAAYWVDGLLIDAGPSCTARQLVRVLRPVKVEQIALTHAHEDHIGGLAALHEQYPGARIYASNRALSLIEDPRRLKMQPYRRLIWGMPRPTATAVSFDEVDNTIRTPEYCFRIVDTPGHSVDHVSLFEPSRRWVFSGDAFIGGIDRAWASEFDLFGILGSMRTLASLQPERLFPGSGNVRRTPLPEIHGKITALTKLAGEVAKLEALGMTAPQIVASLFKEEPAIKFWTVGHFSAANLVEACRSYNAIFFSGSSAPAAVSASMTAPVADDDDDTDPSASESSDLSGIVQ